MKTEKKYASVEAAKITRKNNVIVAILGLMGVITTAMIGYWGIHTQVYIPIKASQTAEAKQTQITLGITSSTQPATTILSSPTAQPIPAGLPSSTLSSDNSLSVEENNSVIIIQNIGGGDITINQPPTTPLPNSSPVIDTNTPTPIWNGIVSARMPTLNEIRANYPVTIWDANSLDVSYISLPGIKNYEGKLGPN